MKLIELMDRWLERTVGGPLGESEIAAVESRLGFRLPDEYRALIARWNGAYLRRNFLSAASAAGETAYALDLHFFSLTPTAEFFDVMSAQENWGEFIPADMLVIGAFSGSNCLLLGVRGSRAGQVWIKGEHFDETDVESAMYLVATTLIEAVEKLQAEEPGGDARCL